MIIGNSAIQQFVSKAVAHTQYDTADKDAYASTMAGAQAQVAAIADSTDSSTQSNTDPGYNESFAKMMVNLKAALANTTASVSDDDKAGAAAAFASGSDKQIAATDSVSKSVDKQIAAVDDSDSSTSGASSVKEEFLAYMNQSDADKIRQQLTGVSKQEYDSMTPEQQAAIDKNVNELQKARQEQQVAEQEVKTRIAMAKAEMA
ncbi:MULTISPECIES: hypothetical protein [unclassified Pseudomonas]|uniref:hypothetical protein n=1 Tax=unclassified Pseudomonas TaxID=196821 RepID=UPI0026013A92|nr:MULTISPECIES: hypothetical protein [unclassified Pseudomonas]